LFKSNDGGANWRNSGLIGYVISKLAIDTHDSNTIFVETAGHNNQDTFTVELFRSNDGGSMWTQLHSADSDFCCGGLLIDPFNEETLYVGDDSGDVNQDSGGM
jgi:hypothetical protein